VSPDAGLLLNPVKGGEPVPAQMDGDELVAILAGFGQDEVREYRLAEAPQECGVQAGGVKLKDEGPGALSIWLPEGHFTTYTFDPKATPRPFFFPVLGPGGKAVTRAFPMKDVPGEQKDHPHHRSFWTAYGEVNEVDDWSEAPGKHGFIRHQKFLDRKEGPAFGGFTAALLWTGPDGKPLLDEKRTLRVYNVGPERRLLDYDVELTAAYEDIHYGDTKEGGILAFRVATSMDGNKGGRIENSIGGVGEKQVWGKRAPWLDYSGTVGGEVLGIGMMDHPGNFHHPCYWHARDYGLVGTNPFAKAAFEGGAKEGTHQKKGETHRFRYRVLIHRGNAKEGRVDDAYHGWIMSPEGKAK
jgi:hypothetical protein